MLIDLASYAEIGKNYGITNSGTRNGIGNGVILNLADNPYNLQSNSLHGILSKVASLTQDSPAEEINGVQQQAIYFLQDLLNRLIKLRDQQQSLEDKLVQHFGSKRDFEKYLNFRSGKDINDTNTLIGQKEKEQNEKEIDTIKEEVLTQYNKMAQRLMAYKKIIAETSASLIRNQGKGANKNIYDLLRSQLKTEEMTEQQFIYEIQGFMGFLEESKEKIKKYNSNQRKSDKTKTEAEQKIEEIYKVYKNYTKEITRQSGNITNFQFDDTLENIESLESLSRLLSDPKYIEESIDIDNLNLDLLKKNKIKISLDGLFKTSSQKGYRNEAYQRAKDKIFFNIYFNGIEAALSDPNFIAAIWNEKDFNYIEEMVVSYEDREIQAQLKDEYGKISLETFSTKKKLEKFLAKNPKMTLLSQETVVTNKSIGKSKDNTSQKWLNKVDNAVTLATEHGPITLAYSEKFAAVSEDYGIEHLGIHKNKNLLNSLHLIKPIPNKDIEGLTSSSELIGDEIIYALLNFSKASKGYIGENPQEIEKIKTYLKLFLMNNILDYMFNPTEFESNFLSKFSDAEEIAKTAATNVCYIFNATGRYATAPSILNPIIVTIQDTIKSLEDIDSNVNTLQNIIEASIGIDTVNTAQGLWDQVKADYEDNKAGAWAYVASEVMRNTEISIKLNLISLMKFYK